MPPPPADGQLFREQGRPEVYLIREGERLHIPNPYMMEALGLDWNAVQTVQPGALDHIPLDPSWEPLGTGTPGSAVHVPVNVGFGANAGKVYWPIRLATTKQFKAWGYEVRTIELRGWISPPPEGANTSDVDFSYHLAVDADWVIKRGIDLSALIRVGNILGTGAPDPGITDPRAWCATPLIKMEIVAFPPKGQRERSYPPDWTVETPRVLLDDPSAGAANGQPVKWPFDPAAPLPSNVQIQGGEYVRVFGSIVTDKAHPDAADMAAIRNGVVLWRTGLGNNEDDQARWTEVHPPDWIQIINLTPPPITPVVRGVTVVAPGSWPARRRITSVLDVDIAAPPKPPEHPDWVVRHRELVGPETIYDAIIEGNAGMNGAAITELTNPPGIRLHVKVAGSKSFTGGSPGKFRALYLLDWVAPLPPVSPQVTVPNVVGSTPSAALSRIRAAGLVPVASGPQTATARVTDQQPAGGTVANRGSRVTMFLEVTD